MPNARQTSLIASPSSSRATNRRRSSITEHSFHGIHASPANGKGVTHVSGTICHPCLGPLKSMPVLHQNVPQIGELGRLARPLAIQSRIGIIGRGVGLVAALLTVEVPFPIAARRRRLAAAVRGAKALHAGPRLDQRAVDREMVVRQQGLDPLLVEYRRHELADNITVNQPFAVLGEDRNVPHRGIQRQPDKPAIDGRPSFAYSSSNSPLSAPSASSTIFWIG